MGAALPSVQTLPLTRKPVAELNLSAQERVQGMLKFSFEIIEASCGVSMEVGNVDHGNDLSLQFGDCSTKALNREIMKKGAEVDPSMSVPLEIRQDGDQHDESWEGLIWDDGKTDYVGNYDNLGGGSSTTMDDSRSKTEPASKHEETSLDRHDGLSIRLKGFEVLQEVGKPDILHLSISGDISIVSINSSTIVKACPTFVTPARVTFTISSA